MILLLKKILPRITLLALSVSFYLVSSSARVTSVKSAKPLGVSELQTTGPIDGNPGTPGSDKERLNKKYFHFKMGDESLHL